VTPWRVLCVQPWVSAITPAWSRTLCTQARSAGPTVTASSRVGSGGRWKSASCRAADGAARPASRPARSLVGGWRPGGAGAGRAPCWRRTAARHGRRSRAGWVGGGPGLGLPAWPGGGRAGRTRPGHAPARWQLAQRPWGIAAVEALAARVAEAAVVQAPRQAGDAAPRGLGAHRKRECRWGLNPPISSRRCGRCSWRGFRIPGGAAEVFELPLIEQSGVLVAGDMLCDILIPFLDAGRPRGDVRPGLAAGRACSASERLGATSVLSC